MIATIIFFKLVNNGEINQPENAETANNNYDMPSIDQNDEKPATMTSITTNISGIAYKIDAEEESALLSALNNYDQIRMDYKYLVRPWMDDFAKKPIINLMTQFSLFKCMHEKCLYATDNMQSFEMHMAKHIDMLDVLTKRGMITKVTRDNHIKFRECPYCKNVEKFPTNFKTMAHMEQHCRNAFQCAHCFYRCREMDYMVLHYEQYHKNKRYEILLCHDEIEFEQTDEETVRKSCENIENIKCGQGKNSLLH